VCPKVLLTCSVAGYNLVYMTTPLRAWRNAKGLSIRQLEAITGINRGKLSIYERGVPVPDDDMAKIKAALSQGGKDK